MKYKNLIFDGSNHIHRMSSALPPLTNAKGERVEVIFGMLKLLSSVARLNSASRCYICMDGPGSREIRQAIDPVYKDRRGSTFSEEDKERIAGMHAQAQTLWEMFGQYLPITWMVSSTYEADDIMAMVAAEGTQNGELSLIVSGDGDMLQLVSDTVVVYSPSRNSYCTPKTFLAYTKGYPDGQSFLLGKVLQGEPPTGDNIPGIKGCGEVWAKRILEQHNWDIGEVLNNMDAALVKSKLGKAITCVEGRDRISKNYKLMSLRGHKKLKRDKVEIRVGTLNKRQLQVNMAKYQFSSLLASFNQFINPFMSFGG